MVSNESVFFLLRHCVYEVTELERLGSSTTINKVATLSSVNKRRGNLLLLINLKELLSIFGKSSLQQSQSREIASRIQQYQLSLFFIQSIRRLAMTGTVQEARFL
jgi:hypothetical protein